MGLIGSTSSIHGSAPPGIGGIHHTDHRSVTVGQVWFHLPFFLTVRMIFDLPPAQIEQIRHRITFSNGNFGISAILFTMVTSILCESTKDFIGMESNWHYIIKNTNNKIPIWNIFIPQIGPRWMSWISRKHFQ